MPRPSKRRRICDLPPCRRFEPHGAQADALPVILSLDEYETIRLIDFLGLTQEQCAAQMHVARTTVQAIYTGARAKVARSLVMGMPIEISGGDVVLCGKREEERQCAVCLGRGRMKNGRSTMMKIAVTYDNGQIYQHFGHCAQFKLYEIEEGKVASTKILDATGSGHSLLAGFLMVNGVDDLICGGIGGGAQTALRGFGIKSTAACREMRMRQWKACWRARLRQATRPIAAIMTRIMARIMSAASTAAESMARAMNATATTKEEYESAAQTAALL